jgi:Ca2+/Na+ antiporter
MQGAYAAKYYVHPYTSRPVMEGVFGLFTGIGPLEVLLVGLAIIVGFVVPMYLVIYLHKKRKRDSDDDSIQKPENEHSRIVSGILDLIEIIVHLF